MTAEQWKGQIKVWLVAIAAGIGGWFVHAGWISTEALTRFINGPVFVAFVTVAATAILNWVNNKKENIVAKANAIPEVKGVVMMPTQAGHDLAQKVAAGNTVAPAGTLQADEIASK